MATNMNEDKIVETINQIKNTSVPNKSDLISVLQSLIQKMGIAKSADEIMLKAATDDSGKLISQAITYFIGEGKDEPMAELGDQGGGSLDGSLGQLEKKEHVKGKYPEVPLCRNPAVMDFEKIAHSRENNKGQAHREQNS